MKAACAGLLFLLCQTLSANTDPCTDIRQLRAALAKEQQAIVRLEKIRDEQNTHLHQLQRILADQLKATAKLVDRHNGKALLGYPTRLARSQIKLIGDIRIAEAANATLLQERTQHQHTLKKLLLQELKKTHPPSPTHLTVNKIESGTIIRAVADGKVIFADWLRGFGLMVIISHGHGYMSLYGRNNVLYAKIGDNVSKGQVIASINKRNKIATEGYFELRHNGTPLPTAQNTFILIQSGRFGRTPV